MAIDTRTDLRRWVVAVTAALALLLAAGCGADSATTLSDPEPQEGQPVASPTVSADDAAEDLPEEMSATASEEADGATSLTGIVGGDTALEGGCLWVEVGGERYQLAPTPESGLEVDTSSLQIRRTDGTVVASAGDEVIMTGTIDAEAMTFCQVGPVFMAIDVGATS